VLIIAECSENPLTVLPILDAQDHTRDASEDVRMTSYALSIDIILLT
jgi:hypothetical protein